MTSRYKLAAAIAMALSAATAGAVDINDMFSVRGFGTTGVVHSDADQSDFRSNSTQPNGAGFTESWDFNPDSKVAGQLNARFSDKWSAVVQGIVQYRYDEGYDPQIEWANIKYQATDDLALRVGRIVQPTFLISDSRNVGYANPWVRPPGEVYLVALVTNNDGLDATYSFKTGSVRNSVQGFYGTSKVKLKSGTIESEPSYGLNYTAEFGDSKVRFGIVKSSYDQDIPQLAPLFNGLTALRNGFAGLGFQTQAGQAAALLDKYSLENVDVTTLALGYTYDPGQWFLITEGSIYKGESFVRDNQSAYLTAGYRFGAFTPYATVARLHSDEPFEPGISTAGLPAQLAGGANALNAGIRTTLHGFGGSQTDFSVGARWDFWRNMAFKVQYDRIRLDDGSQGLQSNLQPGFQEGINVNLISLALDFTF